jgi:glucose-6-phosphate dehydrogenase assembly protein OpcA
MATTYKVLGQAVAIAGTPVTLYTVPSSTEAIISSIVIANRGAVSALFRVAIRPNAETLANKHYVAYDVTIDKNDSTVLSFGLTLDAADVVTVQADSTNVSFSAFGTEIA